MSRKFFASSTATPISGDARAAFIASALVNQSSPIPSQIASPGAEITWFCRHFTSPGEILDHRHVPLTGPLVEALLSFWDRRAGYDRMDEHTMRSHENRPQRVGTVQSEGRSAPWPCRPVVTCSSSPLRARHAQQVARRGRGRGCSSSTDWPVLGSPASCSASPSVAPPAGRDLPRPPRGAPPARHVAAAGGGSRPAGECGAAYRRTEGASSRLAAPSGRHARGHLPRGRCLPRTAGELVRSPGVASDEATAITRSTGAIPSRWCLAR
jgi:hypothetical protein